MKNSRRQLLTLTSAALAVLSLCSCGDTKNNGGVSVGNVSMGNVSLANSAPQTSPVNPDGLPSGNAQGNPSDQNIIGNTITTINNFIIVNNSNNTNINIATSAGAGGGGFMSAPD